MVRDMMMVGMVEAAQMLVLLPIAALAASLVMGVRVSLHRALHRPLPPPAPPAGLLGLNGPGQRPPTAVSG